MKGQSLCACAYISNMLPSTDLPAIPATLPLTLQLRALHRQKLTQPLERLLRLRRRQMLHRLQQMRRNVLVQVHPRWTAMRYRLCRRLLSRRAGMWAVARGDWRRWLHDGRGCGRGWSGLDGGLEGGGGVWGLL
jgi:hypothetical protein